MISSDIFTAQSVIAYALSALAAYLLGSISFAVIFSLLFSKDDVRNHGSGNAGATNVLRSVGLVPGILTFVCDFAKGAVAILLSRSFMNWLNADSNGRNMGAISVAACVAGLFAVLGHLYPLYFGFRGGKGVMTLAGIIFILSPLRFAAMVVIFLIVFLFSRTVSMSSCALAVAYPITTFIECFFIYHTQKPEAYNMTYVVIQVMVALIFSALVLIKHKDNIKRILDGTEPKFTIKKKDETIS